MDEWSVGRSGAAVGTTRGAGGYLEAAEQAFTAPERYNKYYQARFHTQWPGVSPPIQSESLECGDKWTSTNDAIFAEWLPR